MGCDYYIYKYLKIKFSSIFILPLYIELERDRGYFNCYLDEDDPDYDKKYKKNIFSTESEIKKINLDTNKTNTEQMEEIVVKYSNIKDKINKLWNKI